MSGKLQIEFDDSDARDIEALATFLRMTPVDVSHFLASLAGKLSEVILRLPTGKRDEFHRSLARFQDRPSVETPSVLAELFGQAISEYCRNIMNESETASGNQESSEIVDDEELSEFSDELMIRKAELYRRLAR